MNHLNEDKLIQYAFDLLDADERHAAQQHLDACGDCRNALAALKAKFAAMDALDADEIPADALITRTITQCKQKPGTEVTGSRHPVANVWHRVIASCRSRSTLLSQPNIPPYRRVWVQWSAAAAAVALVCVLFLQNLPDTRVKKPDPMWAKHPASESGDALVAKKDSDAIQIPATPLPDDRMAALSTAVRSDKQAAFTNGVRVVSADEIPDVPPFAPASAIELVVLPKPDKTQVTIYNSKDLTLVRDTRKLTLKPGWNWLQFMWANTQIDPTSLSLTPLSHADKVDIQLISYPARLKDIGRWLIRSEVEGAVPFEITYFASGLSWRAFYMGTMNEDETTMDLKGYVNVSNNSGQDFENTQTRLIVGETRLTEEIRTLAQRRYPYGPDIMDDKEGLISHEINYPRDWKDISNRRRDLLLGAGIAGSLDGRYSGAPIVYWWDGDLGVKEIEKTGLSEYFLYTIEGTEDLTNQWTKRLPSFDVNDIPVKSLYKYDDDRYGKQPVRFVSFKNDTEHELGETPIPEGNIKIYRNLNDAQNLSYVGGSNIKYIPVNEDIELNLGPARLVKVEPVLIDQKTENHTFDPKGNIDGWDDIETYKVTIANTRDIPIDIEITWNMGTDAWELDYVDTASTAKDAITYKKHDKNRARYMMTVRPKSEKVFGHTIRKYRQKRIEVYIEKQIEQEQENKTFTEDKNGNFTLYVSNQSFAVNPVDIQVFVDGKKVISEKFDVNGGKMPQHNWIPFHFKVNPGNYDLRVESKKGKAVLNTSFEIKDKHWAVIDYWNYPKVTGGAGPTPPSFTFNIQNKPIGFQ
ncbi:MAG: hypothetical protein OEV87_09030 [Phycisphaerae bacterium]|nr:hypothetical protein [Phycisphaerae bacterium]